MNSMDDFWDDLLGHIRQRMLITIVGPDLTIVDMGGNSTPQTLTSLIGQRLVDRYELTSSPTPRTIGAAVAAYIRERGREGSERLYRVINDIIADLDPTPGEPLYRLAEITDLRLLISTTPDRLLAQAINAVRFQGLEHTRELTYSPTQSTAEQSHNMRPGAESDTVVLRLFGKTGSTPQYAIHEEDRLEWLHALVSDATSLPDWLAYQLKHQPILFIGCEIPDWLGRFLIRMSSSTRLSLDSKQYFLVGQSSSYEPALSEFFATYCRKTQVQQLAMPPAEFVAELARRWRERSPMGTRSLSHPPAASHNDMSIFISYAREDMGAARRLYKGITAIGGEVWLDERRLRPGQEWEREILNEIRRKVRLFIPVISANTERADEGYVFREWAEAVDRSRAIPRRNFIIPVVIDGDFTGDAQRYRQIPDEFQRLHFGRAPEGELDSDLLVLFTEEIRAMRRADVA
jgi:hypothetical protein